MTTEHEGGGGAADGRGPRRVRRRALAAWGAGALLVAAAVAAADERYATSDDVSVLNLEHGWAAMLAPPAVDLCTGHVTFRRVEETRDPASSTAALATWTPLSAYETGDGTRCLEGDGTTSITHDGGGDLETFGTDGYFMYRFTACGASCFLRIVLEAEDGAWETWRIRYHGAEEATVANGPDVRAGALTFRDDYFVTWNRDVVNTDGVAGEFDEDKTVRQDFAVRLRLVDGTEVHEGATFALSAPNGVKTTRAVGPSAQGKVDDDGVEFGASLGITWGAEKTYTTFSTLALEEREHTTAGSASVTRALPCPDVTLAGVDTWLEGDFTVRDHESFNGSLGARQELTLAVVHQLAAVQASGCVDCPRSPPPPPTTPPLPPAPPVTTPHDPPVEGAPSPTTPTEPGRPSDEPAKPAPSTPAPGTPLPTTPCPTGPGLPLGPLLPPDGGAPFVPLGGERPADGPLVPGAGDGAGPSPWPSPEASPWPGPEPAWPMDPRDPDGDVWGDLLAPLAVEGPPAGRY
ncbi:MAG: hypothetical protein U1E39_11205 [Planctomycetota bacterium]